MSGKSGGRLKGLCAFETRFDDLAGDAERMGWLDMETAMNCGEYRGGNIGPRVGGVHIRIND